jgi:membrane-bound lytic murein transglycosylase D
MPWLGTGSATGQAQGSLWNIARRFGVTTDDLRSWNKLAENGHIRPGDQLKGYSR